MARDLLLQILNEAIANSFMAQDPVELKVWFEMMKRTEARLKGPEPNIWMSISSGARSTEDDFDGRVDLHVQKIESAHFEIHIDGKKTGLR
jgi:hypothetical protein